MKIEKEFWVSNSDLAYLYKGTRGTYALGLEHKDKHCPNKITISWEEDRKVTISESEFEEKLRASGITTLVVNNLLFRFFGDK